MLTNADKAGEGVRQMLAVTTDILCEPSLIVVQEEERKKNHKPSFQDTILLRATQTNINKYWFGPGSFLFAQEITKKA